MSPLPQVPVGRPARAIHAAYLDAVEREFAATWVRYLEACIKRNALPAARWQPGTGLRATPAFAVVGKLDVFDSSPQTIEGEFPTGGPHWTTGQVADRRMHFVLQGTTQHVYDTLARAATRHRTPPPRFDRPPPAAGAAPAILEDYDGHIKAWAHATAALLVWKTRALLQEWVYPLTRCWFGRATAVNTAERTVTVALEPFPTSEETITDAFEWGYQVWTMAKLRDKRVRVLSLPWLQWVDDIV